FDLGVIRMGDVGPAGAPVVVAAAAWNTSAANWSTMLGGANSSTRAGVVAWVQPTDNYMAPGGIAPELAWGNLDQDLLMLSVPEPGALELAGLGTALVVLFRKRR